MLGIVALKAGKGILSAAKAAGSPTRMVPQLIGPAKEMPVSYFHLATQPYSMSQAELGWRLASYHATATGVVAVTAGANDGIDDIRNWSQLRFRKPLEGNAP